MFEYCLSLSVLLGQVWFLLPKAPYYDNITQDTWFASLKWTWCRFFAVRWNTEISSGHVFSFRYFFFFFFLFRHTIWDAQELQRGSGLSLSQGCSSCSQTYHTDLRPLAFGLPGHCSSPTIPHTPFWGETFYFRLVRGQSPAFVPNKSRQQQEQTERSDCVLSFLWQLLCKGPCTWMLLWQWWDIVQSSCGSDTIAHRTCAKANRAMKERCSPFIQIYAYWKS